VTKAASKLYRFKKLARITKIPKTARGGKTGDARRTKKSGFFAYNTSGEGRGYKRIKIRGPRSHEEGGK